MYLRETITTGTSSNVLASLPAEVADKALMVIVHSLRKMYESQFLEIGLTQRLTISFSRFIAAYVAAAVTLIISCFLNVSLITSSALCPADDNFKHRDTGLFKLVRGADYKCLTLSDTNKIISCVAAK